MRHEALHLTAAQEIIISSIKNQKEIVQGLRALLFSSRGKWQEKYFQISALCRPSKATNEQSVEANYFGIRLYVHP